ncbi:hypothetical protein NECAME_18246, partial [Necator americanus]
MTACSRLEEKQVISLMKNDLQYTQNYSTKAVRAAVILIPVFGLQFLFTIYRLEDITHQVINLVMDGLQ